MSSQGMHFLIMAGGTGGHVFPGIAVAHALQDMGHTVSWLGTRSGMEAETVPRAGMEIDFIHIAGVRGKGRLGYLMAPFMIIKAVAESLAIIRKRKPACVLGMGGFVAGPGAIAAKLLGIPLAIHEQNAIPGTTNRILARFANRVLSAFPGAFPVSVHAEVVGNPVRASITTVDKNVAGEPLHILVVGGSLGAKAINEIMPVVRKALDFPVELRHQTGKAHFEQTRAIYGKAGIGVQVMPFIDDMAEAFRWADVVICRSGAMTVSELAVAGLPAIFIPFPYAIDDHQTANARWMADAGAAFILQQKDMSVEKLRAMITDLNNDRMKLAGMRKKAAAMGIHDATSRVARLCVELAR